MKLLPLLLLLGGASTRVALVDEVYRVPAAQWRYFELSARQVPVRVDGSFAVLGGRSGMRVALLSRADLERMRAERPHGFFAATEYERAGSFHHTLRAPGDYVVLLDNREAASAVKVHVRVSLDFSPGAAPQAGSLSPRRRAAAILISFGVFFGIVFWSAKKLLRAIRE